MNLEENFNSKKFLSDIYMKYSKRLYEVALVRTENDEDARDAVSETFYIAALKIEILHKHPNKIAWLYKVLDFCIKRSHYENTIRSSKDKTKDSQKVAHDKKSEVRKVSFISIDSNESTSFTNKLSYDDDFYDGNIFEELRDVLDEHEIKYLIYKYEYDLATTHISKKLGMSYTATTSLASRIKNKLKKFKTNTN